jgi:oligopeptide transport system ATP-binding protein
MPKNNNVDYNQKVLEVRNLKKYFIHGVGKNKLTVPAVDGLTFDIYKREVFGLVGESGCGKTTTGRTIIKLLAPTEGRVNLNGKPIVAGYRQNVLRIKEIKQEAADKILSLNPAKAKEVEIKKNLKIELDILNNEITKTKNEQKIAMEEAIKPMADFKAEKYHAKSTYQLEVEKINYNYHIESTKIKNASMNQAKLDYDHELAGAKIGFKRKIEGLKESAALQDEVRERRIQELTDQYEKIYKELEAKYAPLITEAEGNILPKAEVSKQITELKQRRKALIKAQKDAFNASKAKIVKPDKADVKKRIAAVKEEYAKKINDLKQRIQELKDDAKAKISKIQETIEQQLSADQLKEEVAKIKEWKTQAIAAEKQKIHEAKTINKSQEAREISQKMQMIFQDPISSLNPRMTVQEIVGEGLTITGGYSMDEIKERVGEVLEVVGLSREYAARYPHEFSGGQRQRIGVARALIMNPDFIIADEPISALDVSIRAQVINLLSELKEKLGLTILFIAHDLSVVQFFCDRIAVMYYGKIVELTTSEELFKHPMHPYTRSLLSSIPQPDPDYEKNRKRINYSPSMHDYRRDKPSLRELAPDHFVYANDKEFEQLKKEYAAREESLKKVK